MVDLTLDVPGEFLLVDHALSRAARGLVGKLVVDGDDAPAIFNATAISGPDQPSDETHEAH